MSRRTERILLFLSDLLTVNAAYVAYYALRVHSGIFTNPIEPELWLPLTVIYFYWLLWFAFFGLYLHWYAQSRLDEVITLFRTTGVGTLVLFFLIFMDDESGSSSSTARWLIVAYWLLLFVFVSIGRLSIRALQKRLLEAGIGARNTVIVGWSQQAFDLCDMVLKSPALGYKLVGFIPASGKRARIRAPYRNLPILGPMAELPRILVKKRVKEVLVGLDSTEHAQLLQVMKHCDGYEVGIKIIPDLYDIVSGQARVNSIHGIPLIEVNPQIIKPWEEFMKRAVDVGVSALILVLSLPMSFLIALAIKLNSRGPIFYRQERVGRNGKMFTMVKFRSMAPDAEKQSGPKWAEKNDPRVTHIGRIIRRLHFDEVPQFFNVLVGDMSLVGPRPERLFFVEKIEREIPLYRRRLKVRPGITGWAQIKYHYDQSIEDVRSKLKDDLFYIENMSWRMDLKILFNTFYVMLRGKGHT